MSLLLSRDESYYVNRLRQIHLRLRDHLYRFLRLQDPPRWQRSAPIQGAIRNIISTPRLSDC
jgi:hypothetical protein